MGLLENITVYLCGPVERSEDGAGWRDKITPDLKSLGMKVWNPLRKPKWMRKTAVEADGPAQRAWKEKILAKEADLDDVQKSNKQIRTVGKRLASAADIIICHLTGEFTAGTFEELTLANGKPVLFWSNDHIPSMWLYDQFDSIQGWEDTFFNSWESLFEYLKQVDNVETKIDAVKWIFLTWSMDDDATNNREV